MTDLNPQLLAYEQATLGACLLNADVLTDITAALDTDDFADQRHRLIWTAVQAQRADQQPVDPITIAGRLAADHHLAKLPGGADYLHTLAATIPNVLSGTHYASKVKRAALLRSIAVIGARTTHRAHADIEPLEAIAEAQRALAGLATGQGADSCVQFATIAETGLDRIEEAAQAPGGPVGLPTGYIDLDRLLGGCQNGRLHLVGALSGAGKSVFMGDIFRTWMSHKIPSCLVTLEMGRDEVWRRQASAACRIPHDAINAGKLDDDHWSRLARWIADTADAPSWVCDKSKMTLPELDALVMRGVETHGWQGVLVDYAQIIRHSAPSRERAVAEIVGGLKEIARKADIPVITGAQLNRDANRRPGPPKMSDLRESAALEHESDVIVLLYRPDYDEPDSPRAGEADFIVAKNRGGPKDTVTLAAQMNFQRFSDMALDDGFYARATRTAQ